VTRYIRFLAWLHIVLNGMALAVGIIAFAWLGLSADDQEQTATGYIGMFFLILVPFLVPGLIGGIGLLRHKPWARILLIILSAIWLLEFPVGTALGAFGLWVLLSRDGQALFVVPPPSAAAMPAPGLPSYPPRPLSPPSPLSLPRRNLLSDPVFGILAAMFLVAAGFVLLLAIGFRLHGEVAPAGIDDAVPAAALVMLVVGGGGGITLWRRWQARLRRRSAGQEMISRSRQLHAKRLAELNADPAKRKYIPLVERGESWSDEQITYHEDHALTATCTHLQPIEQAMRQAGIDLRRITSVTVSAKCRVNESMAKQHFTVQPPIFYVEDYQGDRGAADFPTAFFTCRNCHSSISTLHPDEARADTTWFPAAPAAAVAEGSA